jgi:hypothetical protein
MGYRAGMRPDDLFDFFSTSVLNETVNISLKHRYIYFEVPKAGSVSIKTALHAAEIGSLPGPEIGGHPPTLHSPFVKPYQLSREHLLSLLRDPAIFKFSFVRDPYARLLSAYLNMMHGQEGGYIAYYRHQLCFDVSEEVSFAAFAARVCRQMPNDMDKHWRPQFYQSFAAFCDLDFVGKLETFDDDVKTVSERVGIDLSRVTKVAPHATNAVEKLARYYTPDISAMVAGTYGIDFLHFGYDATPASLPRHQGRAEPARTVAAR